MEPGVADLTIGAFEVDRVLRNCSRHRRRGVPYGLAMTTAAKAATKAEDNKSDRMMRVAARASRNFWNSMNHQKVAIHDFATLIQINYVRHPT